MSQRMNYAKAAPELFAKLGELSQQLHKGVLDAALIDLVNIRASQINGCAFCLDMHIKEAKIHGLALLKIIHVQIWRESPLFSEKERMVLEWAEAVTKVSAQHISDELFEKAKRVFSEQELSELTFAVGIINAWNRLAISFQVTPGSADKLYGLDKAGF